MQRGRLAALVATGTIAFTALCGSTVAGAAGVPNACKLLGVKRSLAVQLYGAKASVTSTPTMGGTPPNLGSSCTIEQGPGQVHYKGAIYAEPYAASEFSALVTGYSGGPLKQSKLRNLGHGAVWVHGTDPSQDGIVFKRGKYAVLLSSGEAGGAPKSVYPPEKWYITVAHAIYKHI